MKLVSVWNGHPQLMFAFSNLGRLRVLFFSELVVDYCSEPWWTGGRYPQSILLSSVSGRLKHKVLLVFYIFIWSLVEIKDRMHYCMEEPKRDCWHPCFQHQLRVAYVSSRCERALLQYTIDGKNCTLCFQVDCWMAPIGMRHHVDQLCLLPAFEMGSASGLLLPALQL